MNKREQVIWTILVMEAPRPPALSEQHAALSWEFRIHPQMVTQLDDKADSKTAREFLEHLLKTQAYTVHTILTHNAILFAEQPQGLKTECSRQMRFNMICEENDIDHRLTKANHPWTND